MRWLLVIVCLTGCDQLWNLQHVDQPTSEAGAIDADLSMCPTSYGLPVDGYAARYRHYATGTTWDDAETLCERDVLGFTHLVVLQDDGERMAIILALAKAGSTTSVWIGLSDRVTEDQFLWVTDEPVGMPPRETPPWPAGQPDNGGPGAPQNCVRIQGANSTTPTMFDDADCTSIIDYICECDGYAPAADNF